MRCCKCGEATITLLDSMTLSKRHLTSSGSDITLDLAGCTLTGNGQTSVITVAENTAFTLKDSTGTDKGTVTGGNGSGIGSHSQTGGGVVISAGARFTMTGGSISGNTATYGSGVYVDSSTFTMTGGSISGNTAGDAGGGVYVGGVEGDGGTFTMTGGTISRNNAGEGGGVSIEVSDSHATSIDGTFIMAGGTISDNTAYDLGGGLR